MLGKSLLILSAIALAAVAGSAEARRDAVAGSSQLRNDLNTHTDDYGYHPGRRSFYDYPRHRHIDGGGDFGGPFGGPFGRSFYGSYGGSPNYDGNYGSPYYGTNYGAPYYGGSYYDGGVYYRERRD